jgi:pimeloyl-ACP methyl ester carboxylesterase
MTAHVQWLTRLALESLQPLEDRATPFCVDTRIAQQDPILLLHGFGGTPRMLRPLARFLRRKLGRPTFDLPLGVGLGDIRDSAIRAHRLLDERGVTRCDVVGYSMGGLVASYLLKCLDRGHRIRRVVTLGTPHRGVPLISRWPSPLVRCCRAAEQMRIDSPFLDQLKRLPLPAGTAMLSVAGSDDAIVPVFATQLDERGARNFLAEGVDHCHLITSRHVFRSVERDLRRAPPRSARPIAVPVAMPEMPEISRGMLPVEVLASRTVAGATG